MATLKQASATLLSDLDALGTEQIEKLGALSVNTVEELFGLIVADPDATAEFLGTGDLAGLQADLGRSAGPQAMRTLSEVGEEHYPFGAAAPPSVEVEERADPVVFEDKVLPAAREGGEAPGGSGSIADCMNPIRYQGERGSCVAHAVCALAEGLFYRSGGSRIDLSEQFLYWNAKKHDNKPDREGTLIEIATDLAVSDGICLEQTWPYNPVKQPGNVSQDPPSAEAAPEATQHRLATSELVQERSADAVRGIIDEGRPVALSVPVYKNWDGNPAFNAYGFIPMPLPNSACVDGHAMCAVGYAADEGFAGGGYLVLRNSWGADWAPQSPVAAGHALLPYLYLELYGWETRTATA